MDSEYLGQTAYPAPEQPAHPRGGGGWRLTSFFVAGVALVALAGLGFLLVQANEETSDVEASLAETEDELEQITSSLTGSQDAAAALEDQLATAQGQLDQSRDEVEAAKAELEAASDQLDEAEQVRAGVIEFLAVSFTAGTGMSDSEGDCIANSMAESMGVGDLLAGTLSAAEATFEGSEIGGDMVAFGLRLVEAAESCDVSMEALAGGGLPAAVGNDYGDSPALDALHDQCAAGTGAACDQLYFQSPAGSAYEQFAETCGERFSVNEAPFLCESSI